MRSLKLKRTFLIMFSLFASLALMGIPSLDAASLTATLTADNHYGLYVGNGSGTVLQFIGRNEIGPGGNPGLYNWSLPETWNANLNPGEYLYVLAWNDEGPQSWIGQFAVSGVGTLYSDPSKWQYSVSSNPNPGEYGDLPSLNTVKADIAAAQWAPPLASAPNGTDPWGEIPGISSEARFIWHDTLDEGSSSNPNYVLFRTTAPPLPIPLPGSLYLLGSGLAGLALGEIWRRRFRMIR